jgi:Short C-terminal domain
MFMRRRPLLRAAAVGGGAYMAGKRRAQNQADQAQTEAEQNARISDLEQQQDSPQAPPPAAPPTPAPAAPGGSGPGSLSDQLKQLSSLHEAGALSDDEFAAAKQKLLGT